MNFFMENKLENEASKSPESASIQVEFNWDGVRFFTLKKLNNWD
jgi:hypothetical protein